MHHPKRRAFTAQASLLTAALGLGLVRPADAQTYPSGTVRIIVPYGPYRCGDGQYVNLAVQNEGQWRRLCERALVFGHQWRDERARSTL